jgi:phage recombination protein Bet
MTSTAIAIIEKQGWDTKLIDYIRENVLPNVTDEELLFYFTMHKKLGLDPFMKNIWVIRYGGKNQYVTSIKALRTLADRSGRFFPSSKKTEFVYDDKGNLISATKYICKLTPNGILAEGCSTAMWDSFAKDASGKLKGSCWKTHPELMLEKCAEARCLRENFPGECGDLYIAEEFGGTQPAAAETVEATVLSQQEINELRAPEVRKLGSEELQKLGSEVAKKMMDDREVKCVIMKNEMTEFLSEWQDRKPLFPTLDKYLTSDKKSLLDAYIRWQGKRAA